MILALITAIGGGECAEFRRVLCIEVYAATATHGNTARPNGICKEVQTETGRAEKMTSNLLSLRDCRHRDNL